MLQSSSIQNYWLANGYSDREVRALVHGFLNALTFGLYRNGYCWWQSSVRGVMEYDVCMIYATNNWMIMRQLYPGWYSWGGVPAIVFSPIKSILSISGVAVSGMQEVAIEVVEAGLSVSASRAPGEAIEVSAQSLAQNVALARISSFATALTM